MAMNVKVTGDKLVIEIDIGSKAIKEAPMSKSGKNKVIASTNGFMTADEKRGIKLGLNVITKD